MRTVDLTDRSLWSWRQSLTSGSSDEATIPLIQGGWRPCLQFPSLVQAELQQAGLIPDFALKRNEELVQWVGEADWLYRCEFELDQLPRGGETADLVFDGLDTFATVFLNGKKVLEADNMFLAHRVPATKWLQRGANTIYIAFHSAFRRARQLEEEALGRGKHWPAWNGDKSRLFVRKGGWNWSWDWGPCLMTAGPFRPVRLEVFESRIENFWPRASVSENLDATLSLRWDIVDAPANCSVTARLLSPGGSVFSRVSVSADEVAEHVWYFEPDEIELWWTAGLGAQPLFEVQVDLVDMKTGAVLESATTSSAPSPLYYFVIKRALAPIAVVARRYTVKEYRDRFSVVDVVEIAYVDVWASSSGLSGEKVVVRLAAYEILTGKRVHQEEWTTELEANRSTELKKLEIPLAWNDNKEAVVVHASLHTTKSGSMLSSVAVWPEPFKYLTFPKPKDVKLDVRLVRHKNRISKATVFLSSSHPLKGLVLDFAYDVKLSDNFLDLMPGETREIDVAGLPSDNEYKLTWRYLGDAQTP